MSATTPTELQQFHDFIAEQIDNGGVGLTPEEALDLWRAEHPTADEITESVAAIREVIADIDAGDTGRDAKDILFDLRKKHGIIA